MLTNPKVISYYQACGTRAEGKDSHTYTRPTRAISGRLRSSLPSYIRSGARPSLSFTWRKLRGALLLSPPNTPQRPVGLEALP